MKHDLCLEDSGLKLWKRLQNIISKSLRFKPPVQFENATLPTTELCQVRDFAVTEYLQILNTVGVSGLFDKSEVTRPSFFHSTWTNLRHSASRWPGGDAASVWVIELAYLLLTPLFSLKSNLCRFIPSSPTEKGTCISFQQIKSNWRSLQSKGIKCSIPLPPLDWVYAASFFSKRKTNWKLTRYLSSLARFWPCKNLQHWSIDFEFQ
jgi:hypothetical protein